MIDDFKAPMVPPKNKPQAKKPVDINAPTQLIGGDFFAPPPIPKSALKKKEVDVNAPTQMLGSEDDFFAAPKGALKKP